MVNVAFTTDLSRVSIKTRRDKIISIFHEYGKNIKKIHKLLGPIFGLLGNIKSNLIFNEDGSIIDRQLIYEYYLAKNNDDARDNNYNFWASEFFKSDSHLFKNFLDRCRDDVVIGFEMSAAMMNVIDNAGMTFINIRIDPIRFLPDLIMNISTNSDHTFAHTAPYCITEAHELVYASLIKATNYGRQGPVNKSIKNGALVVCQLSNDFTVISNGNLTNISDYKDTLLDRLSRHDWIYIAHHPYNNSIPTHEIDLLRRLGPNAEIIFANGYSFLLSDGIKHVYTIGSSLGAEARVFNKKVSFLNRDPSQPINKMVERHTIRVSDAFSSPAFWETILSNLNIIKKQI